MIFSGLQPKIILLLFCLSILEHWTNKVKSHFKRTGRLSLSLYVNLFITYPIKICRFKNSFWYLRITLKQLFKLYAKAIFLVIVWHDSDYFSSILCEATVYICPSLVLVPKTK